MQSVDVAEVLLFFRGKSARVQSALLSLSAIVSQYRFTAAFPRRVSGKQDRRAVGPRPDRALTVPA
jgi:hypothetical protein